MLMSVGIGCMPVPTGLPEVLFPPAAAQVEANEEAKMGTPKRFQARPRQRLRLVPEQTKKPKETKAKNSEPRKPKETQTKKPKEPKETKQRAKRQTKKEQDEQAVNKFLASPAWEGYLSARISAEVDKQSKSAKLDRVYKKAEQVMKDFALLGDGNPEQFAEEEDCLVTYLGKMVQLQLKRKRQLSAASNMAEHP